MNIKTLIIATAAIAPVVCGCDDIKEDDRYLVVEGVTPVRAVLIEDFTGQNCVNCPTAHATIEKLVEQYGATVIPVSIHAGGFGVSVSTSRLPSYVGLMQPEGNTLNDKYGIKEWPKGVVNGRRATNPDEWAAEVRTELAKESPLSIVLEASYNAADNTVEVNTTMMPAATLSGRLNVWVVENGIVAFQRDITAGRIPDYVHNHVYRASLTGTDGEPVSLQQGIHSTATHSIAVRNSDTEVWNPANLSIVAFVSDNSGVLQAASANVISE